ncbi:STAS domain-containing protein [Polyangium fumosum]|uniref:STAS domain-containing protein n=1 Tax=Polyangium fumosum TaxID=889272 RepID=A0A4U1J383_9BACT|nr:STAS domain-containing protein [Polyangium fumosum]TKD01503.1 STAS domain-containing protein [Polyangium fumosum]
MSDQDLEQENRALRARVVELEERLAALAPPSAPARASTLELGQLLRLLLDHLDLIVWAVDESGTFTFHDGKGIDALGIERGAFLGQNLHVMYGAEGTSGVRIALAGTPAHDIQSGHGMYWENWYIPVRGEHGAVKHVVGLSLNVTETTRTREELDTKLALIERQQEVIQNLETPIIQVWDHVITLPMVGVVDSHRAARVTEDLLAAVSRLQARFAILDLTGVDVVDTGTASHMLNILGAVRLLGAEGIITGIRPNVAQTMVSLGLDLSRVITLATLRDGLSFAIRSLGDKPRARTRA